MVSSDSPRFTVYHWSAVRLSGDVSVRRARNASPVPTGTFKS